MVKIEKKNYKHYGNCVEITSGKVIARITCDIGPRIIYYGGTDEENIMFEDINDLVNKDGEYFDANFKKGETWHIYGGHRLWKSPEDLASYYPDNYPIEVEIFNNGAKFIGAEECTTGVQKSIEIRMNDDGVMDVIHYFRNFTDKAVKYSLWALSVMNKGGSAYAPMSTEDTGLLANRNLVIWPYTDIKDKRIELRQDGLVLHQNPNATTPIKLGTLNTEGVVYYLRKDKLVEKKFEPAKRDGNYPDYSCNMELYTSPEILEVETISELTEIMPGQTVAHSENWTLYTEDDVKYNEIKEIIFK